MYKKASKLKLRFVTPVGKVSVEMLWTLSLTGLNDLAIALEPLVAKRKSFISDTTEVDVANKLRFDIVCDIITTKLGERDTANTRQENKEKKQVLMGLLKKKEMESMESKSPEEIRKMLADLD